MNPQAVGEGEWSCSVCTFINFSLMKRCEMCDTPKNGKAISYDDHQGSSWSSSLFASSSSLPTETYRQPLTPEEMLQDRLSKSKNGVFSLENLKLQILNHTTIFSMSDKIEVIFLSNNELTIIPPEFVYFQRLRELHMQFNSLIEIPSFIGKFIHLEKLLLSHNQIVSIPAEIGQLSCLRILSLFGNNLETVCKQVGNLKALTHLYLNENRLISIPNQ